MNEKMSFERPRPVVVGPTSQEEKEKIQETIVYHFGEGHYEQLMEVQRRILESKEYPKKYYEIEAINLANKITNNILKEFGLQTFDVPERNIHIIPDDFYKNVVKNQKIEAATFIIQQFIVINAEAVRHPIDRIATILHEITHLKAFLSFEGDEGGDYKLRHWGLSIYPSRKKEKRTGGFEAFVGLNEAVVGEIEKRYFPKIISEISEIIKRDKDKSLATEFQWQTSEEAQKLRAQIALQGHRSEDEIRWVSKEEDREVYKIAYGQDFSPFPYYPQRKVLYYIVEKIYNDNPQEFNSPDDVMKLFFRAHFDGELLTIDRLIKKSFGREALSMIAMMGRDESSANFLMDRLRKMARKKKSF